MKNDDRKDLLERMAGKAAVVEARGDSHEHCWHAHRGPIMMVLKDGHVLQKCCHCDCTRQVHRDHLLGSGGPKWSVDGSEKWGLGKSNKPKLSVGSKLGCDSHDSL